MNASSNTTQLLEKLSAGDRGAADALLPLVYDQLRSLAEAYLRRERRDHTLQPTALVHEAYLKLIDQNGASWQSRAHFMAVAAKAMRQALINHALARKAVKRGGGTPVLRMSVDVPAVERSDVDPLVLSDALQRLAALDRRKADVVEMRYCGGMTSEEAAHVLGVSLSTVEADWRLARAWLSKELGEA
jgi:RNA polymerase sigma factor (TIGR02999 family)